MAILAVESFVAYGFFVETKGKALEEIAVIFDEERADVRVDDMKHTGVNVEEAELADEKARSG